MKPWELRTPHAFLTFAGENKDTFEQWLNNVPGIRAERDGSWRIPDNALTLLDEAVQVAGVTVSSATWGIPPEEPKTWEQIEDILRKGGELRPEFLVPGWLKDYQKIAITSGWSKACFHAWHSTGSGKTPTGIILSLANPGTVLVVTKAATRLQYAREIERFTFEKAYVLRPEGQMSPKVTVGGLSYWQFYQVKKQAGAETLAEIRELWKQEKAAKGIDKRQTLDEYLSDRRSAGRRAFVVVAWENLVDRLTALTALSPSCIIWDESHVSRNSKRYDVVSLKELPEDKWEAQDQERNEKAEARSKNGFIKETEEGRKMFLPVLTMASAAAQLARATDRCILTSATPVANRLRDLWAQLDIGEPNAWGNATKWQDRHCARKPGVYGGFDTTGQSNVGELEKRLKNISHTVTKGEMVASMPEVRRVPMYIDPADLTKPEKGFKQELTEAYKRGPTAVLEVRLAEAASMKRQAVLDLIDEHVQGNQKVAILTARRQDCDTLGDKVRKAAAVKASGAQVWSAHGGHGTDVRQAIVDEFMAHPGPCVFVGTGHAFGTGINMDTADVVLFVMLPYTPEQIIQWEGRFYRVSTKKKVTYYYIIAEGTVDEHVASILLEKLPMVQALTGDSELQKTKDAISGIDHEQSDEDFAKSILDFIE